MADEHVAFRVDAVHLKNLPSSMGMPKCRGQRALSTHESTTADSNKNEIVVLFDTKHTKSLKTSLLRPISRRR
jgi:hypothetical protein